MKQTLGVSLADTWFFGKHHHSCFPTGPCDRPFCQGARPVAAPGTSGHDSLGHRSCFSSQKQSLGAFLVSLQTLKLFLPSGK